MMNNHVQFLSNNLATPHCIIFWQSNGEDVSKTVCYTPDDEKWALDRFHTVGDFYNSYDKAVIHYGEDVVEYDHLRRVGA